MLSWLPSPNATDSNVDDYPCCDNTAILQEILHVSLPIIFGRYQNEMQSEAIDLGQTISLHRSFGRAVTLIYKVGGNETPFDLRPSRLSVDPSGTRRYVPTSLRTLIIEARVLWQ